MANPLTARERKLRQRQRERADEYSTYFDMPHSVLERLIEEHYISDRESVDPVKRGDALKKYLLEKSK